MIFDVENWLWKSNVGTFWHLSNSPISIISLGWVDFKAEIFLILYTFLENSTTRIAIPDVNEDKVSRIYSFFDCVENQREVHSKACVRKNTIAVVHKLRWQDFGFFLTTYPPPLTFSTLWILMKSWHFWTTYPPPLVNIVCEWHLEFWCNKKSQVRLLTQLRLLI